MSIGYHSSSSGLLFFVLQTVTSKNRPKAKIYNLVIFCLAKAFQRASARKRKSKTFSFVSLPTLVETIGRRLFKKALLRCASSKLKM
jgi:hypothetical protein